ncbi:Adenine DNA glycosylase [subsurface metagenome]
MIEPGPAKQLRGISAYAKRFFHRQILTWFGQNKRRFPWRETNDPYCILVAEILLQQTDAAKVSLVYPEFIQRYPDISKLAKAEPEDLQEFISKIGLNYRAQRLVNIARDISDKFTGRIPDSEVELMKLPGAGRYIANAVLSAAFGMRTAVVDTNIVRILERFFGIRSQRPRARTDPELWSIAHSLLPRKQADCRDWNYALIDFCALVCTHYNPKCSQCVCAPHCWHFSTH